MSRQPRPPKRINQYTTRYLEFAMRNYIALIVLISFSLASSYSLTAQDRFVELEVVTVGFGELGAQQEVMEMLSKVGADRISSRNSRADVRAGIEESETDGTPFVRVVAVLDGRHLRLPGKRFSTRDVEGIKDFIQKLRDDGASVTMADKKGFGLTSPQLVAVYEQLSGQVARSTKGRASSDVIAELARSLSSDVVLSAQAERLLAATPVKEEFEGLSTGTSLASILRPLGLVLAPRREQGSETEFLIAATGEVEEHWPVGWPIEETPLKTEPRLFERLDDVSINDFALQEALDAIQARVEVPFLYDQNGIARSEIELSEFKVTLVRGGAAYYTVIRKLLSQTKPKLGLELRRDENGKPFVWISPLN